MKARRLVTRTAFAGVAGYAVYITAHQFETRRRIERRHLLPRQQYDDPRIRFATMRVHGRFVNPFQEYRHQTLFEFVYCRIHELFASSPRGGVPTDAKELERLLPVLEPVHQVLRGQSWAGLPASKRIAVTWLGQSCALVQVPGTKKDKPVSILTDPMFAPFVVSEYVGPQRLRASPCTLAELPKPEVVLVSHDHQDHLDFEAAKELNDSTQWVVPTGVGARLRDLGITNILEMSWWEKQPLPGVDPELKYEIACVPAMHWSGRNLFDANKTLWCSFLLLHNGEALVYHGGDTGYADGLFSGIKKVYGSPRVALLPCGSYIPQWHLRSQHMSPMDAIKAFDDLGARSGVGVHWGTFVMSEEPFTEPGALLTLSKDKRDFVAPVFGETMLYPLDKNPGLRASEFKR